MMLFETRRDGQDCLAEHQLLFTRHDKIEAIISTQ